MAFKGSVTYIAAGQVITGLPMIQDAGGNGGNQCYFAHVQLLPASSAVQVSVIFDNRATPMTTIGAPLVCPIPSGARVMTVTPTGGSAIAVLGSDH